MSNKNYIVKAEDTVFNWECFRDFCPKYSNYKTRNEALMYYLPAALKLFADKEGNELVSELKNDICSESLTDYRTDINIKNVIINSLLSGNKPSEEELASILDVIYIDFLPVDVEMLAYDLYMRRRTMTESFSY
jgi:hypothetical protein